MNRSTKVSAAVRLTTNYQTVLTVAPVGILRVVLIHIVNTSGSAETINLCYVPAGDTEAESNALLYEYSIAANDYVELDQEDLLDSKTVVRAKASANDALNLRVIGSME